MLTLNENLILLNQTAPNKQAVIQALANYFYNHGQVKKGYEAGMMAREQQHSTFLGQGIAIPHGTLETRSLVVQTGIVLQHFPEGVDWGDGNIVYLAIGIAAKSDEHLNILKQLTQALSSDDTELKLKQCTTTTEIINLLEGNNISHDVTPIEHTSNLFCNKNCLALKFPCTTLSQAIATAAGLLFQQLKTQYTMVSSFTNQMMTQQPTYLGKGLWFVSCPAQHDALALVTPKTAITINNPVETTVDKQSMTAVIVFTYCDKQVATSWLAHFTQLIINQEVDHLLDLSESQILDLLTQFTINRTPPSILFNGHSEHFTIKNKHGLHARPGALLVACTKKFKNPIMVAKATQPQQQVDAKNLMKLISLGVNSGDTLIFTVQGENSDEVLKTIGETINTGLGE